MRGNLDQGQPGKYTISQIYFFSQFKGQFKNKTTEIGHPTVVLQPLGHVGGFDVCRLLEGPHVQNELVGDETCSDAYRWEGQYFKVNANSVEETQL